jgi:HEAT repeat protein
MGDDSSSVSPHIRASQARQDGDVDALLDMLASQDRMERLAAVTRLGGVSDTRVVPALIRSTQATDTRLRVGAVRSLAERDDDRAREELVRLASHDATFEVQFAALEALAAHQDSRAPQLITQALARTDIPWRRWYVRWAAKTLVALRAHHVVGDLSEIRKSAGVSERIRLARAIRRLRRNGS